MSEIVMPRLSDTMEEGTILRWLKGDGEQIARGEELVEIETDKATMTYESDEAGTLELLAAEGDTLPVGAPIARVGGAPGAADAEASPAASEPDAAGASHEAQPAPDVSEPSTADAPTPSSSDASSPSTPEAPEPSASAPSASGASAPSAPPASAGTPPAPATSEGERVKASPLARRMASEGGVDLHSLSGSGPGGRIVKADVLGAGAPDSGETAAQGTSKGQPASAPEDGQATGTVADAVRTAKGETTIVALSRIQQTVARRMAESKATIPDFTLQSEVDMEACVTLRAELKSLAQSHAEAMSDEHAEAPTYNDMVVKACALALRETPTANGSYRDGQLQLHSRVNVGVAVAAHDALVVPTVFDADEKSLGEIARETRALAERVRAGTVTPPELGGGTFTVSNLGMFGVKSFTAIINPPQAAIMSVGSLEQRAVVHDGELAVRHTMTLTLGVDHRILFGAEAARFLARVRELLQTPAALTL
jgi:pyruvate dehydrogenase E2 component (dihydrolipoamide acetyltransferase)